MRAPVKSSAIPTKNPSFLQTFVERRVSPAPLNKHYYDETPVDASAPYITMLIHSYQLLLLAIILPHPIILGQSYPLFLSPNLMIAGLLPGLFFLLFILMRGHAKESMTCLTLTPLYFTHRVHLGSLLLSYFL